MTIDAWLRHTAEELADAMIPSARLDAEIILSHTINHPRTWLHAHGAEELDPRRRDIADARAELRLERVPVAYIIGHKDFYGRRFKVSPATLIPRPESESLIELACQHVASSRYDRTPEFVDVGTGSGCLGLTAKLELPDISLTLTDISKTALAVAEKNRSIHGVEARIIESNLLDAYPLKADIVLANLPYVDRTWRISESSPETAEEPATALYADDNGLALIKQLLDTAPSRLAPKAALVLEADTRQHTAVIDYAASRNYQHIKTSGLGLLFTFAG
jgi:release factor glutamine methyltransferase